MGVTSATPIIKFKKKTFVVLKEPSNMKGYVTVPIAKHNVGNILPEILPIYRVFGKAVYPPEMLNKPHNMQYINNRSSKRKF